MAVATGELWGWGEAVCPLSGSLSFCLRSGLPCPCPGPPVVNGGSWFPSFNRLVQFTHGGEQLLRGETQGASRSAPGLLREELSDEGMQEQEVGVRTGRCSEVSQEGMCLFRVQI